ncbi:hypothetical protein B0H17DRAFT_1193522 [Mycena rosella]|uniref:Uncharacterized protein n=1 Tax=Mycena rosella TaxID=1033263 RepID=A0AAD7M7W8_MYCRO|nr:hypothetical protein B0H17DRAFT_1193522 [Mycena rosella]
MAPEWYFTSAELENYMPIATRKKWDTGEVGMKLKAFAIAGCDPVNLLRTSKQKADWMKAEIRGGIGKNLGARDHPQPDAKMAYTWHEEDVVQRYGIILKGWTAPRFVNPSELSTSLSVLCTLLDAVKTGACKFRKLTPAEAETRKEKWDADVAAGRATAKSRAPRNNIGVPRKRTCGDEDELEVGNEENDDPNDDEQTHTPPKKRSRKVVPAAAKTATAPKPRTRESTAPKKTLAPQDDNARREVLGQLRAKRVQLSRPIIDDSDDDENRAPPAPEQGSVALNTDA